ncbi:MAG: bifunctional riboflavin kinase/FAD synthetase [Acidimicrobiales bacterium]
MRVWRSLDEVEDITGSVVTVGNFDGVHLGHQHVIDLVVSRARESGNTSVVVTFDPHPMSVIHPGGAPLALATLEHRLELLQQRGVDATLVLQFTTELAHLSPEDFVHHVLSDALHVREIHVGENFRFGHRAGGTVETLRELAPVYGFQVHPVALARASEAVWSSTYVRQCLAEGDVAEAAQALGRPHRVEGPVVEGDKRGRQLGYPTANLDVDEHAAVPADGIYAGWLTRESGERLPAAISIGTNPTFGGTHRRVEAYVLDRDDLELYGEHVAVDFVEHLRDTVRFDGIDELLVQMARDVDQTRALLAS